MAFSISHSTDPHAHGPVPGGDAAASVSDLRALLRERFPAAHADSSQTVSPETAGMAGEPFSGVPSLDALHPPMGQLIEVVCPQPGHGGALLLHQLLQQAALRGQPLALVDGSDSLDPDSLVASPGGGARLLWLRCHSAGESVRVTDLLLRDGNLDLLLLDLQLNPAKDIARVADSSWHRLRMLMRGTRRHCLIFTPRRTVPRAGLRVQLSRPLQLDALDQPRTDLLRQLRVDPLRQESVSVEPPAMRARNAS